MNYIQKGFFLIVNKLKVLTSSSSLSTPTTSNHLKYLISNSNSISNNYNHQPSIRLFTTNSSSTTTTTTTTSNTPNNNNNNNNEILQQPEVPTNCCGGGCVNCVYDIYFKQLEEYNEKMKLNDPDATDEPLMTTDVNEDPLQFFMKMERYHALQKRKAEKRAQQAAAAAQNSNTEEISKES
eukprot:gene1328-1674_t